MGAMTGTEFEEQVAALCRRNGCTGVRCVGGANDNGADVVRPSPERPDHGDSVQALRADQGDREPRDA
ncbi:restriction endonuclease [Streptomyces sp. NPDC058877]|uniref:restriction endonuclease n=1 Tax=Streptomyces sp. NPDC058877 TaxID=3346665 RepID=UPI0036C498EB